MNDEKIQIIEGPPPTFELVRDTWANGIIESPSLGNIAVTRLRTGNGFELVERCYRAWHKHDPINLEFKDSDGLILEVPIVAARTTESPEGQLLFLWVRLPENEIEIEFDYFADEDDFDDFEDDIDPLDPSW